MTRSGAVLVEQVQSNGAQPDIDSQLPYIAHVEVRGVAPLLLHNWNVEAVAQKSASSKGSKAKKTDNLESYCPMGASGCPG